MSTRNEMSATLPRTSVSTIDENLKRFFDFIASICGMIVFSPLFLIIIRATASKYLLPFAYGNAVKTSSLLC